MERKWGKQFGPGVECRQSDAETSYSATANEWRPP